MDIFLEAPGFVPGAFFLCVTSPELRKVDHVYNLFHVKLISNIGVGVLAAFRSVSRGLDYRELPRGWNEAGWGF